MTLTHQGYRILGAEDKISTVFGTAVHKMLASWYKDGNESQAIWIGTEHLIDNVVEDPYKYRTPAYLDFIGRRYFAEYSNEQIRPLKNTKGAAAVELNFRYENDLVGTVDLLAEDTATGDLLIVDHKTTSLSDKELSYLMRSFELSWQLMFYTRFVQRQFVDKFYPGRTIKVLINFIQLKRGIEKKDVGFKRSPLIEFPQSTMAEFEIQLQDSIQSVKDNNHKPNFTACKAEYGLCPFFQYCSAPVSYQKDVLETAYEIKPYDPLNFQS